MKITLIAGARPNFMKIAPIIHAIQKAQEAGEKIQYRLVHTGQHYDSTMSGTFFDELHIPLPDINLDCGGGTQAEQTAAIMIAFEKDLIKHPCDLVLVVGDVNSTMACSIVAKKLDTKVAHVEAGIRSGDRTMPEEINRIVTDSITDYFFTTSRLAGKNLLKLGVAQSQIYFVGNVMIDTLLANMTRFHKPGIWESLKLTPRNYIVMTLHRPANVDEEQKLQLFLETISETARGLPIVFPVHPRTKKIMEAASLQYDNIQVIEPLGYLQFNYLVQHAKAVITDSGGITEETTVWGVPCITLRDHTERPETIDIGTNELIGTKPGALVPIMKRLFDGTWKQGSIPELWDGKASERIIYTLIDLYG